MAITLADKYTSIKKKSEIYSDFTSSFFAHPETKQLVRITNEDAVKNAIRNIVLTNRYERFYRPNLAGDIRSLLFENMVPETENRIKTLIESAIKNYEPRAQALEVNVLGNPDEHSYAVTIIFYVINNINPINLILTLFRVR